MTRRIILAFIVLLGAACLSRPAAAAASFTAGVDRATVAEGEGFTLHLSLSGTGATESPDLSPLKQAFTIVSQGRSSQTTIINGQVSSSIDWAVTLIPLKRGKTMIPAISLATDAGNGS